MQKIIAYKEIALLIIRADIYGAFFLSGSSDFASPGLAAHRLSIRIRPLELAQQAVAALDGEIEGGLRRPLAAEGLLQFVVDRIADQNERSKPDSLRILGRRLQ